MFDLDNVEMPILPIQKVGDSISFYSEKKSKILKGIISYITTGYNNGFFLTNIIQEEMGDELHLIKNENILSDGCNVLIWEILKKEEITEFKNIAGEYRGFAIIC